MAKNKHGAEKPRKTGQAGKRDNKTGRFMGVRIADPPVKPRGITVREIRRAVDAVLARRKHA